MSNSINSVMSSEEPIDFTQLLQSLNMGVLPTFHTFQTAIDEEIEFFKIMLDDSEIRELKVIQSVAYDKLKSLSRRYFLDREFSKNAIMEKAFQEESLLRNSSNSDKIIFISTPSSDNSMFFKSYYQDLQHDIQRRFYLARSGKSSRSGKR